MNFVSLFSGIGGFDLGFERAGMQCAAQVEKDKFCRNILDRHFPGVFRLEDVRHVGQHNLPTADLICGGFPCQDVSLSGRRAGLAGERSGLWFEFARVIGELKPEWVVIENVAGLLSSHSGRDFAVILSWLVECGYGVVWRVFDSQYFGVPQRRRRVFIVGHLGDGRAAKVLFEPEGLSRHFTPRGAKGASIARAITTGSRSGRRNSGDENFVVGTLASSGAGTARPAGQGNEPDFLVCGALQSGSKAHGHAMTTRQAVESNQVIPIGWKYNLSASRGTLGETFDMSPTIDTSDRNSVGVRRLTPVECERLQGFPDGWTAGQSDSARYRQLGNAVTVNVAEWIGRRIVTNP